ncbi:MAG: caspase family protein [Bacteroidetes bacterium]|nr:caspase family protein [Bacteroidota bacterium]
MKKSILLPIFCLILGQTGFSQLVADRSNKINLDFSRELVAEMPEIIWQYPRQEYTNSEENQIEVKATVSCTVPLKDVTIFIKQSLEEEALSAKPIALDPSALTANIDLDMSLIKGQNYLEIRAENEQGGVVTDTRSILVGMDALKDAIAIDRKDYALLFATDRYDNWTDLVNPINDAETISKELSERFGFEVEIVKDASQDDVFNKLRQYAQRNYKPQDQLFIFFAGHGQYDETFGEGYIVAKNSLKNDDAKTSYISKQAEK